MATLRLVPATGNPIEVTQASVLLGRDPACDVVLADGSVSRKHARLEQRDDQWFVVDQGSANGTFLDSVRATDTAMRNGQEIRFGAVSFRIEIAAAGEVGATVLTEPIATVLQSAAPTAPNAAPPPPPPPPPPSPAAGGGPPPPPPPSSVRPGPRPPVASPPLVPKPAKKGRGPGFWVGLSCCGCLVIALLGAAGFFGWQWLAIRGAQAVADQNLLYLREGNFEAAWQQLSPSVQDGMPPSTLAVIVAAHPALHAGSETTLVGRAKHNQQVTLTYRLRSPAGEEAGIAYTLQKEDDIWRITAVNFVETPGS